MRIWKRITAAFKKGPEERGNVILINILTRTSGRPIGFNKCHSSVLEQSYPKVRHMVSYDTKEDLSYLRGKEIDLVKVKRKKYKGILTRKGHRLNFEPYNLYCNRLLEKVKGGWIVFLDDDDMLANDMVIEELVSEIKNVSEDNLLIFKTEYPDGRQLPDENAFEAEKIEYMNIDTACFAFNSKYAARAKWDAWRGADFRYIRDLANTIPQKKWIPKVITLKNNFGDQGNRNDLPC